MNDSTFLEQHAVAILVALAGVIVTYVVTQGTFVSFARIVFPL
jgi:hypothetical protein